MRITAIVVLALTCAAVVGCERKPGAATAARLDAAHPDAAAPAVMRGTGPGDAAGVTPAPVDSRTGNEAAADRSAETKAAATLPRSEPEFREVTLPTGTALPLVLDTAVGSDTSRVEEAVRAHVASPVSLHGVTVLPTGSAAAGTVTSAVRSGKVRGRAHVAIRFDSITRSGDSDRYRITAAAVERTAPATRREDTLKVVAPAAGGAIIGRIAGGRKGAAIGTAVGAGAGGAAVMSTRGKEVRFAKGTVVTVRLSEPLVIRVPRG
jgi:hypothetical protein